MIKPELTGMDGKNGFFSFEDINSTLARTGTSYDPEIMGRWTSARLQWGIAGMHIMSFLYGPQNGNNEVFRRYKYNQGTSRLKIIHFSIDPRNDKEYRFLKEFNHRLLSMKELPLVLAVPKLLDQICEPQRYVI